MDFFLKVPKHVFYSVERFLLEEFREKSVVAIEWAGDNNIRSEQEE